MIDFDLAIKTKIYFGKGKELLVGQILKEKNAKKVFVVIGGQSVRKSGLLDRITNCLKQSDISYEVFSGIRANPTKTLGDEGIQKAREFKPDYILAIGGGSVMDTAKYIAVGYYYDKDAFDFNMNVAKPQKALPVGVILTISASGSEMSTSCVMQNDETGVKRGFNSELIRPEFAIENPEITYTVNQSQTAFGIVDTIMHTLERYLQVSDEIEPADGFAETVIKSTITAGRKAMQNPNDYQARAVLMLMSSLSHNGLTNIAKPFGLPVHQLEHPLSGLYPEVAHGEGLAILWPAWAQYYLPYDVDKFDALARNVFDSKLSNKYENAKKGILLMQEFFISLGIPSRLSELKTNHRIDIDALVNQFSEGGTRVVAHHAKPMDQEVARIIYENCF